MLLSVQCEFWSRYIPWANHRKSSLPLPGRTTSDCQYLIHSICNPKGATRHFFLLDWNFFVFLCSFADFDDFSIRASLKYIRRFSGIFPEFTPVFRNFSGVRTRSHKTSGDCNILILRVINGSPGGDRTHDQLLRRQLLYPLSYRAKRNALYIICTHLMKKSSLKIAFSQMICYI